MRVTEETTEISEKVEMIFHSFMYACSRDLDESEKQQMAETLFCAGTQLLRHYTDDDRFFQFVSEQGAKDDEMAFEINREKCE